MEVYETWTATIGSQFVCPIEYDDRSGLDTHEDLMLQSWLDDRGARQQELGRYIIFTYGTETDFAQCEITGMMSDCVVCTATALGNRSLDSVLTEYVKRCGKGYTEYLNDITDWMANELGFHIETDVLVKWLKRRSRLASLSIST